MSTPRVSVLIPAYNVAPYIAAAISSVLTQTLQDFEILVIDDASCDETFRIASSFDDARIRVIRHDSNLGVAKARNTGIDQAEGEFIALLDSDDIAFPNRLATQVTVLDQDQTLMLIGSQTVLMDEKGRTLTGPMRSPIAVPPENVEVRMIFRNMFGTSTIMFRKHPLASLRYRNYTVAEDYDFNVRAARIGKVARLSQPLTKYRVRGDGLSGTYSALMKDCVLRISHEHLRHWEIEATNDELVVNRYIGYPDLPNSIELLEKVEAWLLKLCAANDRMRRYDQSLFQSVCGYEWFEICKFSSNLGMHAFKRYASSPLAEYYRPPVSAHARLLTKCVLRYETRNRPDGR
jgi:glycosyltransferase involved in cell wall biosynthesis